MVGARRCVAPAAHFSWLGLQVFDPSDISLHGRRFSRRPKAYLKQLLTAHCRRFDIKTFDVGCNADCGAWESEAGGGGGMGLISGFKFDSFLAGAGRLLAICFAVALGIASVAQAFSGNATVTATCGALAIFALLVSQMHLIESFSGFGIQAKLRKLDEALGEADEALNKLRKLAAIFSRIIVDTQSRAGRMGGAAFRDRCATAREVRQLLLDVGASDQEIRSAIAPWAKWMALDISYGLINRLGAVQRSELSSAEFNARKTEDGQERELRIRFQEFSRDYLGNPYFTDPESYPERIYEIAKAMPFGSEETRGRVVSMIDRFAPSIRSILTKQDIPASDKHLEDLERVARHHGHGDPLAWQETKLED